MRTLEQTFDDCRKQEKEWLFFKRQLNFSVPF